MKKLLVLFGAVLFAQVLFAQDNNLSDYVGTYKFQGAPFNKIVVTLEDGSLVADAEGVGKGKISASDAKDVFGEPNYQAILKFVRDGAGNVAKLSVKADGVDAEGLREGPDFSVYVGEYVMEQNSSVDGVKVLFSNGTLSIDTSVGSSVLKPTKDADIFILEAVDGKAGFTRDENGKVKGISIMAMGTSLEGKKK